MRFDANQLLARQKLTESIDNERNLPKMVKLHILTRFDKIGRIGIIGTVWKYFQVEMQVAL